MVMAGELLVKLKTKGDRATASKFFVIQDIVSGSSITPV